MKSEMDGNLKISLACLRCRAKKSKCTSSDNNTDGRCDACSKASLHCEWPSGECITAIYSPTNTPKGRRRKRTRKEMEAARQKDSDQTTSPLKDLNLMRAVTSQVAYIDDGGGGDEIKVYYVSGDIRNILFINTF